MNTRIITLTGRSPIKIDEDLWPVVASGSDSYHDGQVECQANRKWLVQIKVRQHRDGRTIVSGIAKYSSNWQNERDYQERAGVLLPDGSDLAGVIAEVGRSLAEQAPDQADRIGRVVRECVADLPAEDLTSVTGS